MAWLERVLLNSASKMAYVAGASGGLFLPGIALAEDAPLPPGPPSISTSTGSDASNAASAEIVVSGIRQSLESAISRKRDAVQIVDSIVADDIGKLPDTNVADALERVTGVQITQDRGEGGSVAIRGLSQIETQLNGNTIFTASDRGLNFQDIPAALMAGIDVYKTPSADQIEGGVGGIIDLRTHRPFDFKGFKAAANLGATYADPSNKAKPKLSGMVSDNWETGIGRIGILVAGSYEDRPYFEVYSELNPTAAAIGKVDVNGDGAINASDVLNYAPGDFYQASYGSRRRSGLNGSIQWKPASNLTFYTDIYHAQLRTKSNASQMYIDSSVDQGRESSNYQGTSALLDYTLYPGTNDMKSGTFSLANVQPKIYISDSRDNITNVSVGENWKTGRWAVDGNFYYATTSSHYFSDQLNMTAVAPVFGLDTSTSIPTLDYKGFDINNPANFTFAGFDHGHGRDAGSMKAGRLDVTYKIPNFFLTTIKAGYRYSEQSSEHDSVNAAYRTADVMDHFGEPANSIPGLMSSIHYKLGTYITPDPDRIRDRAAIFDTFGLGSVPGYNPLNHYSLKEQTDTGYVEGLIHIEGIVPIDGNLGVRIVRTRDDAEGVISNNGTIAPNNKKSDYTDVLPSFNLTFHLSDTLQARAAGSKTITRPSFSQLAPILTLNPFTQTGSNGNPDLRPIRSTGFDVSLAWYFNKGGYVSGDVFYKKVDGFISETSTLQTYDGLGYLIVLPVNANKGKIKGAEAGYQQFFTFLPGALSGLGVQANYTYVDSSARGVLPDRNAPLANLSRHSFNAILMYEKSGIWARLAYNWRSRFLSGTRSTGIGVLPIYQNGYGMLDASLGYHITPQISVALQGVNLTKTHRTSYYDRPTLVNEYILDDRRVEASLTLSF